jgi:hypothetical protein
MDPEKLRHLVATIGYDRTLALLYQTIRNTPAHGAFINEVDAIPDAPCPSHQKTTLIIVPGALYKEYPETGADGKRFVSIVQALGIRCHTIPVKSLGSLAQNARIITDWLAAHPAAPDRRRILVSFSKGSADLKTALQHPANHPPFRNIRAWLSVGGILHGTPLIAWLNARPLRHFFIRQLLRLRGIDPRPLQDLAHGPNTSLAAPLVLPPWLPLFHLVTLPTANDLSIPLAQRAFHRLLPLGPNDAGGFLLGDLHNLPGLIYPLQHTDHYLRNCQDLPTLLSRLLLVISNVG